MQSKTFTKNYKKLIRPINALPRLPFASPIYPTRRPLLVDAMNGSVEKAPASNAQKLPPEKQRDWKLLVDPLITGKKEQKVFRMEGLLQGETLSTLQPRDPRSRITSFSSKRYEPTELPVPR